MDNNPLDPTSPDNSLSSSIPGGAPNSSSSQPSFGQVIVPNSSPASSSSSPAGNIIVPNQPQQPSSSQTTAPSPNQTTNEQNPIFPQVTINPEFIASTFVPHNNSGAPQLQSQGFLESNPALQATVFDTNPNPMSNRSVGVFNGQPNASKKHFSLFKKLLILLIPLLLIGGGGVAAYFGMIVPNKPQNIWHKALINMGTGTDKLIEYGSTLQKTTKGLSAEGSYSFSGSTNSKGTISMNSYGQKGELKSNFGLDGSNVNIDLRSILADKATVPDYYLRVSGLKLLNSHFGNFLSDNESAVSSIDNQWILINQAYIKSMFGLDTGDGNQAKITSKDILAAEQAINDVNKKWLWTDNEDYAVLEVTKNVGKEKQDNRSVYHYSVNFNKSRTTQYLKAVRDKFKTTDLYDSIRDSYLTYYTDVSDEDIENYTKDLDESKDFDVWVDTRTKLFHKIRFTFKDGYIDIGQDYQGGSKFPFTIVEHDKKDGVTSDFNLQATLDKDTNKLVMKLTNVSGKDKFAMDLTISQKNSPTDFKAPTGAKSINEILTQLDLDDWVTEDVDVYDSLSSTQSNAQDVERQTDIKTLHSHLEAYYAQNGLYPKLTNLNNSSWRATNMRGLDSEALKDPQGTSSSIVAAPAVHAYSYEASVADGTDCSASDQDCAQYLLTATLSDGNEYLKMSLN